jgi:CrcB protein
MMHKLVLIGVGGLLGTLCRFGLSTWVDARSHSSFPYGTLVVNLLGCFAAGLLFPLLEQAGLSPDLRLAIFTGFLGGFTTFSAYGLQTMVLAHGGMMSMATVNVLVSNVAGLLMVGLRDRVATAMIR